MEIERDPGARLLNVIFPFMVRVLPTLLLLFGLGSVSVATAQDAPTRSTVEVGGLRASTVRDAAGVDWFEYDVEIRINASGSGRERFVDRVGIALNLALEVAEAEGGFEFYRASATAVTIEAGRANFRFYLPPEIVRRDRVQGAPRFYVIDVTVAGEMQPLARDRVARAFTGPEAVDNFRQQLAQRAPANDGVLLPQHLSPFATVGAARAYPSMIQPAAAGSTTP